MELVRVWRVLDVHKTAPKRTAARQPTTFLRQVSNKPCRDVAIAISERSIKGADHVIAFYNDLSQPHSLGKVAWLGHGRPSRGCCVYALRRRDYHRLSPPSFLRYCPRYSRRLRVIHEPRQSSQSAVGKLQRCTISRSYPPQDPQG